MKRKRWFAMILVLGLLIPLMPLSFASATELAPGQIIPDGIYYINNPATNRCLKVTSTADYIQNYRPELPPGETGYHVLHDRVNTDLTLNNAIAYEAPFLWKVHYVGNGRYTISSMYNTTVLLGPEPQAQVNGNSMVSGMGNHIVIDDQLSNMDTWTITVEKRSGDYVIQNGSSYYDGKALSIVRNAGSGKPFVVMRDYDYQDPDCHWQFIEVSNLMLFYTSKGFVINNPVRDMVPGQELTPDELDLHLDVYLEIGTMEELIWTSSNETVATVDPVEGIVTANSYGATTITVTCRKYDNAISASYTLHVVPLSEGEYFISDVPPENQLREYVYLSERGEQDWQLSLEDSYDEIQPAKWTIVHVEEDKYYILAEIEDEVFYLAPGDPQNPETYTSVMLCKVEQDTVISQWRINNTQDGSFTIRSYELNGRYLKRTAYGVGLSGSATGNDAKWQFERANILRIQVYIDGYEAAYAADGMPGHGIIRYQLATAQEYYWKQFKVGIEFSNLTCLRTYIYECETFEEYGECLCRDYSNCPDDCEAGNACECVDECECYRQCSHSDVCHNSDSIDNLQNIHHTNITNILLRVPAPQDPIDVSLLFIGHKTCYRIESDNQHIWMGFKGIAFKEYGLIAVNNIGRCPYSPNGVCECYPNSNHSEYSVESSIKTLIHEIGHIFGAKDHYGNSVYDVKPSTDMLAMDPKYGRYYNADCIYGENKEVGHVLNTFMLCEACRRNIQDGILRYFDN